MQKRLMPLVSIHNQTGYVGNMWYSRGRLLISSAKMIHFIWDASVQNVWFWDSYKIIIVYQTLSFKFCSWVNIKLFWWSYERSGRVISYRQIGQCWLPHSWSICKAGGKSLRTNQVKAIMCKQSLSLPLKRRCLVYVLWILWKFKIKNLKPKWCSFDNFWPNWQLTQW